jgi:rare lipoprotein A
VVKINDRMHPKNKRLVDLSKAAAKKLNLLSYGIIKVKLEVLKEKPEEN